MIGANSISTRVYEGETLSEGFTAIADAGYKLEGFEYTDVKKIVCASLGTFIVNNDGTLWVTAYNLYGQLGFDDNMARETFSQLLQTPYIVTEDLSTIQINRDMTFTAIYSVMPSSSVTIDNDISKTYDGETVKSFSKQEGIAFCDDVSFIIELNGNTLGDITNGDVTLEEGVDYTFDGSKITFLKDFLMTLTMKALKKNLSLISKPVMRTLKKAMSHKISSLQ